jgi:hypothetical protein
MARINFRNISTSGIDEDALTINTTGKRLLNFGRPTTTGDLTDGIFAGADNVTIRNFSRVETSGLGAAGIFALGSDAHIDNFGRSSRTAPSSIPIPPLTATSSFPRASRPSAIAFASPITAASMSRANCRQPCRASADRAAPPPFPACVCITRCRLSDSSSGA